MSDERPAEDTVPANPTHDPAIEPPPATPDYTPPPVPDSPPPDVVPEPPPASEPEPEAPAAPPPEVVATGKVVESRETVIIIRNGTAPGEQAFEVNKDHGAIPGHAITIYADGTVELGNHTPPQPPVITVPSQPPSE